MRRAVLSGAALAFGLCLASSELSAYRAWPARHLGQINAAQRAELFQGLMLYMDPNSAQIMANQTLVIDRNGTPRFVPVIIREDQPGELDGLTITVVGNTVSDADMWALGGGNATIDRNPSAEVHFSWGSALVFNGTAGTSGRTLFLALLQFPQHQQPPQQPPPPTH